MEKKDSAASNAPQDETAAAFLAAGARASNAPEPSVFLQPGIVLNQRYRIDTILGHGGFGVTYLAWDQNLQIKVAVKEYLPSNLASRLPGSTAVTIYPGENQDHFLYGVEQFIEEARAVAKFNGHPAVVSVRDFFRENKTAYIVMEYIEGMTLRHFLDQKGGKISYQAAIEIMTPVMDALCEVHRAGMLHRDISPDNIYITQNKQVKLLDFGAARHAVGEKSQSLSVYFKPGYTPLEQYKTHGKQGAWTDVYAVAATIYWALTGHAPREALERDETPLPTPAKLGVDIPVKLEEVLLKALSVKASKRFQTMAEFRTALRTIIGAEQPSLISPILRFFNNISWRRTGIAAAICILLVLGIWAGRAFLSHYPATPEQKNDVRNMLHYLQTNLTVADNMLATYQNALTAGEDFFHEPAGSAYQDLASVLKHDREELNRELQQTMFLPEGLRGVLAKTPINTAELGVYPQFLTALAADFDRDLLFLEEAANPIHPLDNATCYRLIAIDREYAKSYAQLILVSVCQLLLPVDETALKEFRIEFLPILGVLSKELFLWSRDETDLKAKEENIYTQQQNLKQEHAKLAGDHNIKAQVESNRQRELKASYIKMKTDNTPINITEKAAVGVDPLAEKRRKVAAEKLELAEIQKEVTEKQQSLRVEFAPQDADTPAQIWAKAVGFIRFKMYDDAIHAFRFYLNKCKETDMEASVYVAAAINFVKSIDKTGIDYGVLVIGYEPDKPHHPVYKVGDIIVAINKTPCHKLDEYSRIVASLPAEQSFTATILRPDDDGQLRTIDAEVPRGVSRVAIQDLNF